LRYWQAYQFSNEAAAEFEPYGIAGFTALMPRRVNSVTSQITRGFTGHEHVDAICAINMNVQTPAQNGTWGVAAAELGAQLWISNTPDVEHMSGNFCVRSLTLGDFTVQVATSGQTWVLSGSPAAGSHIVAT
jgi:hypothetical protein